MKLLLRRLRSGATTVLAAASGAVLVVTLGATTPSTPAAAVQPARETTTANPLAGGTWGVYRGPADGVYPAWQRATGSTKALLAKVAQRPRVRWLGTWIPAAQIAGKIRDYVRTTQAGDPDVLVQMAIFRLWPHGEQHKGDPMTSAQVRAYRHWVDQAARGIGSARVAMVLEPDLGVALTGWKPAVRMRLAAYAAGVFGALPHTSVYLDASDADWLPVDKAVRMLSDAGVASVRGFALGATHYSSTGAQVEYGRQIVAGLAAAGVPGKHFVIDTADNGQPFTWPQYWQAHPHGDFDNAATCKTRTQHRCVTLGIPPTWQVDDARWGLSAAERDTAARYVDAYLWFGRPWLYRQASPFRLKRTLAVARSTPF